MQISPLPIPAGPSANQVDVGVAVLAKSLDTIETLGQGMIKMMEQSISPYLGQNIDIRL